MTDQIQKLLFEFELAHRELLAIKAEPLFAKMFEKVEALEAQMEEARNAIKRLLHTSNGPPDAVPLGHKSHVWAIGETFQVRMDYKKKADFYDPMKIPRAMYMEAPSIITGVSTEKVAPYAKKDKRVAAALVSGDWMSPSLIIGRKKE